MAARSDVTEGDHEERLRVICHLPLRNARQERAVLKVFDHLKGLTTVEVGGFTHSQCVPPVFGGWWWSEKNGTWVRDSIVVCMIDYKAAARDVAGRMLALKQEIERLYLEHAQKEEEVWVVAHQVLRQA